MTTLHHGSRHTGRSILLSLALLAAGGLCGTAPAGFVSLEKESGVWWFKSPAGKPFLSIGANHVEPVYWQSPNNRSFVLETYGPGLFSPEGSFLDGSPAAEKWAQRVSTNFMSWGFNTLGFHNPLSKSLQAAVQSYYVIELDLRVPWGWNMPRATLLQAFKRRPFDVFGEAFISAVETQAATLVKAYADDPKVLGYAYTDGPPWTVDDDGASATLSDAQKNIHPWVFALMSLPAEAKGKQAWLAVLKTRYPSPEKAGAAYACAASDWSELASNTTWTSLVDAAKAAEDSQAFLLEIMRQWYDVRKQAIRRYDHNHLILGDKLNMNRDSKYTGKLVQSLKVMGPYVDVINIQYYGAFEKQRDTLALLYRESQKPLLNGDTTFRPIWKAPLADEGGFYRELGESYADDLMKLFSLPYFVGWHHCGYMRGLRPPYAAALRRGDQKEIDSYVTSRTTHREGFITEAEEPIENLVNPLRLAISTCEKLHRHTETTP